MALEDIKNQTLTARANLVNAIRSKGVEIADDSTINQCATAITMIQGTGSSGDAYVAVEENGELKLQKLSFNGTEATPDGATEAMFEVGLFPTGMNEPAYAGSGGGGGGGSSECTTMKFYQCTIVDTESKTWSGKELVLTDGVYVVSDTETTGLVYGLGFTPIVGKVYSEDGLLELKDYYQGFLLVSPTDMTSNETDEWVISSSSYREDPYKAFSGSDTETYGWISGDYQSLPQWIQWQNKNQKTKILNYSVQVNGNTSDCNLDRFPGSWVLQGSNDGSSWITVDDRTDAFTSPSQLETWKYYNFTCQNPGSYYYYRIYVTKTADGNTGMAYAYIGQIKAYGNFA